MVRRLCVAIAGLILLPFWRYRIAATLPGIFQQPANSSARWGSSGMRSGRGRISRRTENDFLLGVQQDQGGAGRVNCHSGADFPVGIAEAQGWSVTGHREARAPLLIRIVAGEDRAHLLYSQGHAGFAGGIAEAQ